MTDSSQPTPAPSAKAMGKRAATNTVKDTPASRTPDAPIATTAQPMTKSGMQTRKRVLPSRSRRGGPGVGNCDMDIMILETRRRQSESEPLVPPNTKFLLTTNAALLPSSSSEADIELNIQAYGRYFDRPEVQQACREQALIQTPEFNKLSDEALVGSRFRPRNSDEELVDTSDAAYEKRHRKYETFEKRQRLREKEKLKHEQYKLKERIEQLRAMEASAFLALPASNFSEPPRTAHEAAYDEEAVLGDLPGAHINGAMVYNEGERRRKEMLEVAESLEERYRVLLPPDRKWLEKKEKMQRERASASASISVEPERGKSMPHQDEDEEADELDSARASISAPLPRHVDESDEESEVDFEEPGLVLVPHRSKNLKLRIPHRPPLSEGPATPDKRLHHNSSTMFVSENGRPVIRAADGRFLSKAKRIAAAAGEDIVVPPRKRFRTSAITADIMNSPAKHSVTSTESGGGRGRGRRNRQPCVLLLSAMRDSASQKSRKTHRHITAFGVRVPPEIEDVRDFEVPPWARVDYEEDELEGYESYEAHTPNGDGDGTDSDAHSHNEQPYEEMEWDEDTKEDIPDIETLDD